MALVTGRKDIAAVEPENALMDESGDGDISDKLLRNLMKVLSGPEERERGSGREEGEIFKVANFKTFPSFRNRSASRR